MKNKSLLLILLIFWSACNVYELPEVNELENADEIVDINFLSVPEDFNFETTREVTLEISAVDNQKQVLSNVPFKVFLPKGENLHLMVEGIIGSERFMEVKLEVDVNQEYLLIRTIYPGLPDAYWIPLDRSIIPVVMGSYNGDEPPAPFQMVMPSNVENQTIALAGNRSIPFSYMGTYNNQGRPNYLEPVGDVVDQSLLNVIANSLPEGQPVPEYNPQYIAGGTNANTKLTDDCEVWVTFVHEGAGYRNALGYYTYPTSSPPASVDDIDDFYIIFPNVSFQGSGGQLQTGDKVYLGSFVEGTSIGWFLVPNGWESGTQQVEYQGAGFDIRYSDKAFNTFTSPEFRNHVVLLQDPDAELLLLGIEDINRPSGDNDFNDAMFYLTATPFEAVDRTGIVEVQNEVNDSDGDGIGDNADSFVDDPDIAFISYFPAADQFATLAFEDQWPNKGDYDMNDLVIDYNFTEYRNAANKVIKLRAHFKLRAMGAGYRNGFGFEMDIPASAVTNVDGQSITENYIQLAASGVESGQNKAVIIVFDNGYKVMSNPNGGFVNTESGQPFIQPVDLQIDITLANPLPSGDLGTAPYNPFVIGKMQRGVEIHLPDQLPTQKADMSLMGMGDDDSNPGLSRYYKTANNLPWGINIADSFQYPIEKERINQAYLNFNNWAQTGGSVSTDWFEDKANYRNSSKIYQ